MAAGVDLPIGPVLADDGLAWSLAALAGIIVGNFLVRWAIVMLLHEPLKVPIARRA